MRSCRSCGAALPEGGGPVDCPRCGADNPPDAPPPAQPMPPAAKALGAAVMALVGVGFAMMFFARVAPPDDGPPRPRRPRAAEDAAGPPLRVFLDALCFADANGDEVPDPVLWMDGPTRGRVAAVDGRSGRGLWASGELSRPSALACAGPGLVLAAGDAPALRGLDARTGAPRWTADLVGAPEEIVVGEGCATVLTKDGAAPALRVDSGEPAECPSAPRPAPFSGPFWDRKRNPQVAQAGDVEVSLSARTDAPPGSPPALRVEGRRGGAPLWSVELGARAPGRAGPPPADADGAARPDLFLAVSGAVAVVVGADLDAPARLRVLGVDTATGAVRYDRPATYLGPRAATLKASGPYVYVLAGGGLRALDPATGQSVWRATAPPP